MDILDLVNDVRSASARPFSCPEYACPKTFARRSDLVRHMRIHSNDRPFTCDWPGCTRDFIQRSALTVHYRVHTGERPHECEHPGCHKAFSDSSSLARHRRIHTGKRPYKCHILTCLKTFCRKTTLTKHLKRNHGADESSPETSFGTAYFDYSASTPSSSPSSKYGQDEAPYKIRDTPQMYNLPPITPLPKIYHLRSEVMSRKAPQSWSSPGHLESHVNIARHSERHARRDAFLTPPPRHSPRMRESTPSCDSPNCFPHEHWHEATSSSNSLHEMSSHHSPPSSANLPFLPSVAHLFADPHYYPGLTTPDDRLGQPFISACYSAPMPSSEFTDVYDPPSPTFLRNRRASSTSALEYAPLANVGDLGIMLAEDGSPRFSEFGLDEPASPKYGSLRRRMSSSFCFPGLPSSLNLNSRGSFSSFVTQHIEEMENDAADRTCSGSSSLGSA